MSVASPKTRAPWRSVRAPEFGWVIGAALLAAAGGVAAGSGGAKIIGGLIVALVAAALAAAGAARLVMVQAWGAKLLAASSVSLVMLPTILPYSAVKWLPIAPFVLAIALLPAAAVRIRGPVAWALGAFLALSAIALVRGSAGGAWGTNSEVIRLSLLSAAIIVFVYRFVGSAEGAEREERILSLLAAPGLLTVLGLGLYFVGDKIPLITIPQETGLAVGSPASMLRSLGFSSAIRHQLPLSTGVNSFGVVAAMAIVLSTAVARNYGGTTRRLFGALSIAALVAALFVDSRTALLMTLTVLLIGALLPRLRTASKFAVLLPLTPVVLVMALGSLGSSALTDSLSRTGDDVTTGTGRLDIWTAIWDSTLSQFEVTQLIGYGANGQIPSGAFAAYRSVLDGGIHTPGAVYTAHDIYLQTILDMGYIGVVALVLLVAVLIQHFVTVPRLGAAMAGGLLVLMLCGITEASPTIYQLDVFASFLILCAIGLVTSATSRVGHVPAEPRSTRRRG